MDGLGSASPPVAPTATTGEGRHPCTWPRTFWFKPLSAFGLLDLTTFISSSPELAMPSTLAPNRFSASSRRALSREARPPWVGEVTLSQELRTARSPRPHVLVGYQWSHTGLRPGRKTSHNRYIRSFVSHPPQIRACTSRAPRKSGVGSSFRARMMNRHRISRDTGFPAVRHRISRSLQRQFLVGREAVLPPAQVAVVLHRGLVHLQVAVASGRRRRRRRASISAVAIGWKPRATARFWRRTAKESMPLTVVATGRLMA